MKILFIDDRLNEIVRQWSLSGCDDDHELLPLTSFTSIEQTRQAVATLQPDVIVIGFGLGVPGVTGADVIRALREQGYDRKVIANSGGGVGLFVRAGVTVDASADRNPEALKKALNDEGGDHG